MGKEPDAIRHEIEQTRQEMTETSRAIADQAESRYEEVRHKVDIPGRISEAYHEKKDQLMGRSDQYEGQAKQQGQRLKRMAEDNPIGLAVGAFAAGFLGGILLPETDVEARTLGPAARDLRERAMEAGEEAYDRGKEVAKDAAEEAQKTAQERAKEESEQMKRSQMGQSGGGSTSSAGRPTSSTSGTSGSGGVGRTDVYEGPEIKGPGER